MGNLLALVSPGPVLGSPAPTAPKVAMASATPTAGGLSAQDLSFFEGL